jgi:hypothetical protein
MLTTYLFINTKIPYQLLAPFITIVMAYILFNDIKMLVFSKTLRL